MNWTILITSVLGAFATAFLPQIQESVAAHPAISTSVLAVLVVLANLAKAVAGPNKPQP